MNTKTKSNFGYPQTGLSPEDFHTKALAESDASARRRLFADARQSNLCVYRIYVLAAEVEEKWFATDSTRLKDILLKGVVVFKNPAGQGAQCSKVTKDQWLREASESEKRGRPLTARTLRQVVDEIV